jgi:hypothetical protein
VKRLESIYFRLMFSLVCIFVLLSSFVTLNLGILKVLSSLDFVRIKSENMYKNFLHSTWVQTRQSKR